ncbi:Zinc carboxypeptidase a 1 [Plakobranchus ocellatus]|uniref:Zinc carboxypeptidase a 1 n=1 Tax=Plakobranchus ocellatus TaxID=259542 RepID=A0AAV4CWV3_9GAST|nr:Zinc carboxypeptidase a 1 [Plakobranchus ocellatus]
MESAIRARHGTEYRTGQAPDLLTYAASGTTEDWVLKAIPGIFAVCIELRPDIFDHRGFLLPPDEIIPSAEEYFDGLVAMAVELQHKRNR